jgi:hypothetical protein
MVLIQHTRKYLPCATSDQFRFEAHSKAVNRFTLGSTLAAI